MKWFETVFLPSLEERYSARKGKLWLTKKQASICKLYMTASTHIKGQYFHETESKQYRIQAAPNGCAAFYIMVNGWIVS